jgi:hypothetical protein
MKTPTLIVRLVGLYLLVVCSQALIQIHNLGAMVPHGAMNVNQQAMIGNQQTYALAGLVAGIFATLFAGLLARILTFDSEPSQAVGDFADRMVGRKPH